MKKLTILLMSIVAFQLNAQIITNYTTADGLVSNFVECIAVDVNDNLWFGTSVGVQMFDGSNWINYNTTSYPGMVSDNIKVISAMANGDIWIGTDFGASIFDGSSWVTYTSDTITTGSHMAIISNQVKSIDEEIGGSGGSVWIGTNLGVSRLDPTIAAPTQSYGSPYVHWSGINATAALSNANDVWFSSPLGGITHFDGTTFTPYSTSNGLLSQNATALLIDFQGNKWIGTDLGMSVLNASNTSFVDHIEMYSLPPPHDSINPVVDIAMDSYGRIWTAIYVGYLAEGGVAMWNGNQWEDFHVSDGLAGPNVRGLAIDSQDNIWVATSTGVSKISAIPSAVIAIKNNGFDLFPNPSNDKIYISNENQKIQQLKIYNNLGALVYKNNSNQLHYSIDLSSFSKGLYYVNVLSSGSILAKKIMVN